MNQNDLFARHPRLPRKVRLADVTVRDGFQHEKSEIPTEAKVTKLLLVQPTAQTLETRAVFWYSPTS